MKKALIALVSIGFLILAACSAEMPGDDGENTYTNISMDALKTMLDEHPELIRAGQHPHPL